MMSNAKRLHPVTVIFNMIKIVKEAILGAVGIVALAFKDGSFLILGIMLGAFLIIILLVSGLKWLRYTYRIKDDELQVTHGVIIRKKRHISRTRIQSIDLTQSVIHRLFGLVRVEIETAGSGSDTEASLKAVTYSEGVRIRNQLKYGASSAEGSEADLSDRDGQPGLDMSVKRVSRQITFKRLFIAGTTSGSLGVLAALTGVAFTQIEQIIPDHVYEIAILWVVGQSLNFLAMLVVFVAIPLWVLAIAGTMIKYGRFTIVRQGDELFITRGLLEKRQISIPLKRIQAIGFEQSLLRQPFGYGTLYVEIAGGSIEENSDFSTVLFPIMKKSEVNDFIESMIPESAVMTETLTKPPVRARKFYLFWAMLLAFVLPGIPVVFMLVLVPEVLHVSYLIWLWGIGLLATVAAVLGWLQFRGAGVWQDNEWIHVQMRRLALNQVVIHHHRVQAFEKKQHIIQKRQGLATMEVSIIGRTGLGTHYTVKHMETSHVDGVSDWFSYSKERDK